MKLSKYISKKATSQSVAIPGSGQVANSGGGFAWQVDAWSLLDRFLILGTEGGTFYIGEAKLTRENAANVLELIRLDGPRVVKRIVEISDSGRAPKNTPAIFALALCASFGDTDTKQAAFSAVSSVCRTGTHLFQFASECDELRGWGRGLRRAVGNWYANSAPRALSYQAIKYQQREGWSHRDLLRLAHPKPPTDEHKVLFKWIADRELTGENALVAAFEQVAKAETAKEVAELVRANALPRECVPTQWLTSPEVWEALLEKMPLGAMVRNLGNMTRCGLLSVASEATAKVIAELGNEKRIRSARLHPLALLLAHATYGQGRGMRGGNTWEPIPRIVDALDAAFYTAFANVEPARKRFMLGIDVSGSMTCSYVGGSPLSACEAATAMAMVAMSTEPFCMPMAFATEFRRLPLTPNMRLADALKHTREVQFGGTDCSLPMLHAMKNGIEVNVFVVLTDSETWAGAIHPSQALQQYRQKTGIPAKLVVVGMVSNGFTIANPRDPGMLDIVGFDASAPQALREFACP